MTSTALRRGVLVLASAALAVGCGPDARRLATARFYGEEAVRLHGLGQNADALAAAETALRIRERELGPDHVVVASALKNLGVILETLGRYDQAEAHFLRALRIERAALPSDDPRLATTLNNLGGVLIATQAYERAEPVVVEALRILRVHRGEDHPDVAVAANNLAVVYTALEDFDRAEAIYRQVVGALERVRGAGHPDVATALGNLAQIYRRRGRPADALPLAQRALQIRVDVLGADHADTALALNNLAALHARLGDPQRAERLYLRALQIFDRTLHPLHPHVATTLENLADLFGHAGEVDRAVPLLRRALGISESLLRTLRLASSEARLAVYLDAQRRREAMVYTLLARSPGHRDLALLATSITLLRKGRSVDEAADASRAARMGLEGDDRRRFDELRSVRGRIAALALGDVAMSSVERARELAALERRAEAIELALVRRSAAFRARFQLPSLDAILPEVASRLPEDGALIEYVAFPEHRFLASGAVERRVRYLALVLRRGGEVRVADLGGAADLSAAARRFLGAMVDPRSRPEAASQELHRRLVQPLVLPSSLRRLWIVPDGDVSLVPFGPLGEGGRVLVDRFVLTYLTSGRDLLRAGAPPGELTATLFADPDFGSAEAPRAGASRGFLAAAIPRLPGTRAEVDAIRRLLPGATTLTGADASETALLGVSHPGILHVATHGLFLDARSDPGTGAGRRGLTLGAATGAEPETNADDTYGSPLTRSALVMAGAASRTRQGDLDGLVTALEASSMDLSGTRLVVLSACDSGRGDVGLGDGVFGMRRALVIAGAETLVTSLWRVDDEATRDLMVAFYTRLLAGAPRSEAMRDASVAVRARRPHPNYWAPFIVIGVDGPLDAGRAATRD